MPFDMCTHTTVRGRERKIEKENIEKSVTIENKKEGLKEIKRKVCGIIKDFTTQL